MLTQVYTNLFDHGGIVRAIERNYLLSDCNKSYLKAAIEEHLQGKWISQSEADYLKNKYL